MPLSGPLRNNKRSEVLRCLASFFKRVKYEKFNRQIRKGFADTGRIILRHHGKRHLSDHDSQSVRMHTIRLLSGIG